MADEKAPVVPAKPDFHLIVIHPFGDYQRGDKITDASVIAAMEESHADHHCRKVFTQ